jgi:hypothetical protein
MMSEERKIINMPTKISDKRWNQVFKKKKKAKTKKHLFEQYQKNAFDFWTGEIKSWAERD